MAATLVDRALVGTFFFVLRPLGVDVGAGGGSSCFSSSSLSSPAGASLGVVGLSMSKPSSTDGMSVSSYSATICAALLSRVRVTVSMYLVEDDRSISCCITDSCSSRSW